MNKHLKTLLNCLFGMVLGVFMVTGGLKSEWLHSAVVSNASAKPVAAKKVKQPAPVLQAIIEAEPEIKEVTAKPRVQMAKPQALPPEVKQVVVEQKPPTPQPVMISRVEKKKNPISIVAE